MRNIITYNYIDKLHVVYHEEMTDTKLEVLKLKFCLKTKQHRSQESLTQ